ncbi:MAG: hypothetical protein LBS31_06995 [Candidatus Adiutrix sp.]|nr:hypothetical protein [Candidatus Adiutrix sp.]
MDGTSKGLDFKIPFQLTNTLVGLRNAAPDRGRRLSSIVIKLAITEQQEALRAAAEARANQLIGQKVDAVA